MRTAQGQDWRLLRQYVHGSQAAFDELVKRHIKLVYATCRRELADPSLAEDVTQVVFLILSKKAGTLLPGTVLSRWLFKTARFASKDVLKRESRRKAREEHVREQASAMAYTRPRDPALDIALNEALASLGHSDWEAVHLRFYEEMSFAEIGGAYGISDDAAQKRVTRALDRMRRSIAREGIGLTVVILAALVESEAASAAPDACFHAVMRASSNPAIVGPTTIAGQSKVYGLAKGVLTAMAVKNMAIVAVVVGIALVAGYPLVVQGKGSMGGAKVSQRFIAPTAGAGTTPKALQITVVIDPGHGGSDPGYTSSGAVRVQEKNLNMALAIKVRAAVEATGTHVFLTRESDVTLSNDYRAHTAAERRADYLVSIHCDARPSTDSGTTVYYHGGNNAARALAVDILGDVGKDSALPSRGVVSDTTLFPAGFAVLRESPMPAVLIECGNMNHGRDLAALSDPRQQARIAQGIAEGLAQMVARRR